MSELQSRFDDSPYVYIQNGRNREQSINKLNELGDTEYVFPGRSLHSLRRL